MRIKQGVSYLTSARVGQQIQKHALQITIVGVTLVLLLMASIVLIRTTHASPPCPCTVFAASEPSVQPGLFSQPGGIEVGFRFQTDQTGYISGIRFYKVAGMTGTHTASLWDKFGTRIAQATFSSESAAGWQQVNFSPVAVTPNLTYTASVFMADGEYPASSAYFTSDISNSPLMAKRNSTAYDGLGNSGQGAYNASGSSGYPTGSFNATNYWVDVSYIGSTSASGPAVSAHTPLSNATNVPVTDAVTTTLDQPLDPATIGSNSFVVKDSNNTTIPGTITYDTSTYSLKFVPTSTFQTSTTYTVTLPSGSQGLTDLQGRHLAADVTWSFTTSSTGLTCPCTLRNNQNPSGSLSARDGAGYPSGLELGMKIVPTTNGYITAIRFYKPIITTDASNTGHIWDANGNSLATVTFANESDYGWQEATLSSPLSVTKDTVYVVSYSTAAAIYQYTNGLLGTTLTSPGFVVYPSGDSRNTTLGSNTGNFVYKSVAGLYPDSSSLNTYHIDAVFAKQSSDIIPLHVTNVQPTDKSYGVLHTANAAATFDQALDASTVNSTNVKAYDANNSLVAGTVTYDVTKRTISFTPTSPFSYNATYTIRISNLIKDMRGVSLGSNYNWSLTTGSQLATDITQGRGGPILVITSSTNPYSTYYAEILRTEGFNYFDVKDISTINTATLANYTTVLLAPVSVTQPQVDMLTNWTNGGGSFIAMRPDKKFTSLLGITDMAQTATNQYLRTNVASAAGTGIVDDTIQYKGVADKYTRSGADAVATLYSDSSTATAYPAAITRTVGSGTAMAFTFDLAQSVIGLHQGNQSWSGQDRNGDGTIRSNDLFYGPASSDPQSDWLDNSKIDIPQADEQQRLLANMITTAMKESLPAPRFWYLPDTQKAALVLAGDDHAELNKDGTEQTLNNWLNESQTGCSVMDWQCVRATHYVYTSSPLTVSRAAQYNSLGFELGSHPSYSGGCGNFSTYADLTSHYSSDLLAFQTKYFTLPVQTTVRFHCYLWPSWDWMPRADLLNNVHYDLNSVAYPASLVGTHSPLVSGSGMNMRLTDASGALLDVHQGVTNFDNASAGTTSIAKTFDNALGATGYYGMFGSHYDMTDSYASTLLSIAKSRNIPTITSQQALQWLSGRESSNFSQLASTAQGKETFTITTGEGAHGLQAMIPTSDKAGSLQTITIGAQPVTYRTDVIKGVQYAIFNAIPGDYTVMYSDFGFVIPVVSPTPTPTLSTTAARTSSQPLATSTATEVDPTPTIVDPTKTNPTKDSPDTTGTIQDTPKTVAQNIALTVGIVGGSVVALTAIGLAIARTRRRNE
ncbi:MAG TPA: DUF4082 domain-containing protein [Candidatus Microsaccharimonas sp.]|jgi:hypothetical protein